MKFKVYILLKSEWVNHFGQTLQTVCRWLQALYTLCGHLHEVLCLKPAKIMKKQMDIELKCSSLQMFMYIFSNLCKIKLENGISHLISTHTVNWTSSEGTTFFDITEWIFPDLLIIFMWTWYHTIINNCYNWYIYIFIFIQ